MISFLQALLQPWTWRMAWRDSRRSRGRLMLYGSSIVLGVAALTAISSLGRQMDDAIRNQSKALLGADLEVTSRDAFTDEQRNLLAGFGAEASREISFPSMVLFVEQDSTRLVQIRALEGAFPFYGELETEPANAVDELRAGNGALVEQSLMLLFDAEVGDEIKVGDAVLPIAGAVTRVPGEMVALGTVAPRVYVPMATLESGELLERGSLARYKMFLKFPPDADVERLVEEQRYEFRRLGLRYDTVAERQRELGRGLEHLLRFLNLVGFVALLLGGVGVASGVHVHVKEKLPTVATLRCLGAGVSRAFAVYFAQAVALGVLGSITGAVVGVLAQYLLQGVISDLVPLDLNVVLSPAAMLGGAAIGFLFCVLFAMLPLLPVRRISPLAAFRSGFSGPSQAGRDPLLWLAGLAIVAGLAAFGVWQNRDWEDGLGYAAGIVAAFVVLTLAAWLIARLTRLLVPARLKFVWRQGFSNLHRPHNRTLLLMLSLGMGVFLVLSMYLVQTNLLSQITPAGLDDEGNAVLFDIQTDQKEGVVALLEEQGLPVLLDAPMISMRIRSINGSTVEEIKADSTRRVRRWTLDREYRSTYRSELADTETLVAGTWHPRAEDLSEAIPVSVERDLAGDLGVGLGDEIVFDVQGLPVTTTVASLREVDWRRLSPNFFVVFPRGAIEAAPAIHALVTRVNSSAESARMQREVVKAYPNVSAVDLTLALQTAKSVLDKITFVVRFMALFTVGTGLLVLAGTIVSGRHQRVRESVLLRTLGASRRQVLVILAAEYFLLGVLAAATGIALAVGGGWALTQFVFDLTYTVPIAPLVLTVVAVTTVTVVAGLAGNRGILDRPPLAVLRAEG